MNTKNTKTLKIFGVIQYTIGLPSQCQNTNKDEKNNSVHLSAQYNKKHVKIYHKSVKVLS